MNNVIKIVLTIGLITVMVIAGVFVLQIQERYKAEEIAYQEVVPYRPVMPGAENEPTEVTDDFVDQGIIDLQTQYPAAVGWVVVPHTGVDYPFVQAENNRYYLDRDIDGNYSAAGTLFMDCESNSDFTDFNTVIYGHHMKNGSMFGTMALFNERDFFVTNKTGTIFLANKTFSMEIFAYLVLQADDVTAYASPTEKSAKEEALKYIKENARHYRVIDIGTDDHIVTLSTCAYEFKDARMLLMGRLSRIQ